MDNIYPSDLELYEAYLAGDINYQTYLNLREIFDLGIDSTELYLLEEIPNISYFLKSYKEYYSDLEKEQVKPFIIRYDSISQKRFSGSARLRRYQRLEEDGLDESRVYLSMNLSPKWTFKTVGNESYSGHQEISNRSFNYKDPQGMIKKMVVGNYTARFGLGLTVGYRGKLLEKEDMSLDEMVIYPDYGGFNGLYAEGGRKKQAIKWMIHFDQDDSFRFNTAALNFISKYRKFKWEGIVLGSVTENSKTGFKYKYYQLGIFLGYMAHDFNAAVELAFQEKTSTTFPAVVFETGIKKEYFDLRFSVWRYSDDFINLTGGGRSGEQYRTIFIDTIAFSFRDRRNSQRGLLLKTKTSIVGDAVYDFSFSVYGRNRQDRTAEIMTGFKKPLNTNSHIRLYYEYDRDDNDGVMSTDNKVRIEYRLKYNDFFFRSYIGYRLDDDNKEYLSQFIRVRFKRVFLGKIEAWLNLSRYNMKTGQIDYFYGYVKEAIQLTKNIEFAVKYSHRYSRNYSDCNLSTLLLETRVVW